MTRKQAAAIATQLIEGGINCHFTTKCTAETHGVSIATVRKIKRVVLKFGPSDQMICSMVDAIENGWEDKALNLQDGAAQSPEINAAHA